jgi:TPR repeat protein
MNFIYVAVFAVLFTALQAPSVLAIESQEYPSEADQYYQQGNFKKAYKAYFKLAKTGDNYSQHRVSEMYANGEGKSVNLPKAYAWSTLAAESGQEQWVSYSDELLLRTKDQNKALKNASKLKKKYGQEALKNKAERKGRDDLFIAGSKCTGTRMSCRKH